MGLIGLGPKLFLPQASNIDLVGGRGLGAEQVAELWDEMRFLE
jgi:hypothetical protein